MSRAELNKNAAWDSAFHADVLDGLTKPRKSLSSRWLYDRRGSELFEEITRLPEYYPTRTETGILRDAAPAMADQIGRHAGFVEYGAGALVKTRILLDALDAPALYLPVDISGPFLIEAAQAIRNAYPGLKVMPCVGNFLDTVTLPETAIGQPRAGFFPGSTIGNLSDLEIQTFLLRTRRSLGPDAHFVLGFDLLKSPHILIPAYDDAQGVTAAFNLNLLARINRELDADFDLGRFRHDARWNAAQSRIEMHLVSLAAQTARIGGQAIRFAQGETIHTENSRKFSLPVMAAKCAEAGWQTTEVHTDPAELFAVALLRNASAS